MNSVCERPRDLKRTKYGMFKTLRFLICLKTKGHIRRGIRERTFFSKVIGLLTDRKGVEVELTEVVI